MMLHGSDTFSERMRMRRAECVMSALSVALWVAPLGVLRWSDIPNDRIMTYDPASQTTSVHRTGVGFTNGRAALDDV